MSCLSVDYSNTDYSSDYFIDQLTWQKQKYKV
jgi:hypothetical protein